MAWRTPPPSAAWSDASAAPLAAFVDTDAAAPGSTNNEKRRMLAYAAMHRDAGRHYSKKHRNITLFVMVVALSSTLVTHVVQSTSPVRAALISNLVVTFNAGLTAINNFLGYQARGSRHARAGNDFREAADRCGGLDEAAAAALFAELWLKSGDLPRWVAEQHPEFELPQV